MKKGLKIAVMVMGALFVGCTGLCGGGSFFGGWALNGSGPVNVSRISADWKVERNYSEAATDPLKAKALLQEKCWPMGNGWRILYNHAWYNMITDGYESRLWLTEAEGYRSYGLYIWDQHVFLRNGFDDENYQNRVLTCDLAASDWDAI